MEGPTPVSALIHAATLVTAGVFLTIKCAIIFENGNAQPMVALFGALTAFFASSVGLVQNDMKRVIAFSTCSQLGYMVFVASLSHYSVSLFHLTNHAIFKALLFLSAGCIIHGVADEQDMRRYGGLLNFFPISYTTLLIGSLALIGFPFLTGFYSKDVILELAISKNNLASRCVHFLGCIAAFCTSFYSFRLLLLTFFNRTRTFKIHVNAIHDGTLKMLIPLFVLASGSIFFGYLTRDLFIGLGSITHVNAIFNLNTNNNLVDSEFLSAWIKNLPLLATVFGAALSLLLIHCLNTSKVIIFQAKISRVYRTLVVFLTQK